MTAIVWPSFYYKKDGKRRFFCHSYPLRLVFDTCFL